MRSISDMHRELECSRNTLYPLIKEAGVEPIMEGTAKLFTDDQFHKIEEAYYRKYPYRNREKLVGEQSTLFSPSFDYQDREVDSHTKRKVVPVEEMLEREHQALLLLRERDAETISDLRKQVEGQKEMIDKLLALLQGQNSTASQQATTTSAQRTSRLFPEHDPRVDTLTGDLFDKQEQAVSDSPDSGMPENPRPSDSFLRGFHHRRNGGPCLNSQRKSFLEDETPNDAVEAILQFFRGSIPKEVTDVADLMGHMESAGFPQGSEGALRLVLTKLHKQQEAEKSASNEASET